MRAIGGEDGGIVLLKSTLKERRPREEVPAFYGRPDVLVVASVSEGTPNPALERRRAVSPL